MSDSASGSSEPRGPDGEGSPHIPARASLLARARRGFGVLSSGLSARLLILTVLFVLVAEVVIYVPSIAKYRRDVLRQHIGAAQIAVLLHDQGYDEERSADLDQQLLDRVGALSVILKRRDRSELLLSVPQVPTAKRTIDMRERNAFVRIHEAFDAFFASDDRVLKVITDTGLGMGEVMTVFMYERPVRQAMITHTLNILGLSLIIAVLVSASVYASLYIVFVGPIRRIIASMTHFREKPEDASRIIKPVSSGTELATAERELAELQSQVRAALTQKSRLAALGTAVSKINHDLRNMLASSQLISERLARLDDPAARAMAPKLETALGRAIDLCTNTLKYGRADEPPPEAETFLLKPLVNDVASLVDWPADGHIIWSPDVPEDLGAHADPDQIFRVLLNLLRNALQALELQGRGHVTLRGYREGECAIVEVEDDGPGIPAKARERLFEAFGTSARDGGTGLGLAIAAELMQANGGRIDLMRTGADGTVFRLSLPLGR